MIYVNSERFVKGRFPNGEADFTPLEELFSSGDPIRVGLAYESDEDLFALMLLAEYLKDNGCMGRSSLTVDFMPYSQMDREMRDHVFSLKYVAKLVNNCGFNSVFVNDPHSNVTPALLDRLSVDYPAARRLAHDIRTMHMYDVVMYPDNGAAKKYGEVLSNSDICGLPKALDGKPELVALGVPVVYGSKRRDLATGDIVSYDLVVPDGVSLKGKRVAIIDDLVMGGRTFIEAAKRLREAGASKVALYVSHLMPQSKGFVDTLGGGLLDAVLTGAETYIPDYGTLAAKSGKESGDGDGSGE